MVTNLRKEKAPIELAAVTLDGHTRAFLKLQEGCDQFCTFCIVPFSRGTSRSVEPRRVMTALDDLHARGFKEVVLTGRSSRRLRQGSRSAGRARRAARDDRRAMPDRSRADQLARSGRVERSNRRNHLGQRKILPASTSAAAVRRRRDLVADAPPLRRATTFAIASNAFCARWPDAAIGTDLIVGFPGETRRISTLTLTSSNRCHWRTFTCFRIRCEREPRRRSSPARWRRRRSSGARR